MYFCVYVFIHIDYLPLSTKKVWEIEIPVAVSKAYILASKYIFHSNQQWSIEKLLYYSQ